MMSATLVSTDLPFASADDDIAVGDHAHQPIVVADRQRAGVDFGHEDCRLADGLSGLQQAHIVGHNFVNFHRFFLEVAT